MASSRDTKRQSGYCSYAAGRPTERSQYKELQLDQAINWSAVSDPLYKHMTMTMVFYKFFFLFSFRLISQKTKQKKLGSKTPISPLMQVPHQSLEANTLWHFLNPLCEGWATECSSLNCCCSISFPPKWCKYWIFSLLCVVQLCTLDTGVPSPTPCPAVIDTLLWLCWATSNLQC